ALSRLARLKGSDRPSVLLTTVNAALQRVPAKALLTTQSLSAAPGNVIAMDGVTAWLELNGFARASTVREAGDYAVRGGIIDLFAPGMAEPVRLDFFGDTLETIRSFDPETQRTTDQLRALDLVPVAEFQLTSETIRRFRLGYVEAFGAPTPDDLLYAAVSKGRRHPGMEHWLPLFHERMETIFDYAPGSPVVLEPLLDDAARERLEQIADYHDARTQALAQRGSGPPYRPLPADRLYLGADEWRERLQTAALRLAPGQVGLAVLGLESGFETADTAVVGEQDILGDRLVRPRRQARRPENFIAEVTSLAAGDLVVHVDHGIGRFVGLRAIEAAGAPHDCLELHYAAGDKLFLPVENIELLSRYGSERSEERRVG